MSIEAVRTLAGDEFSDALLDILKMLRALRSRGEIDHLSDVESEVFDAIEHSRFQAIEDGTTATMFPAIKMSIAILEREGFLARYYARGDAA